MVPCGPSLSSCSNETTYESPRTTNEWESLLIDIRAVRLAHRRFLVSQDDAIDRELQTAADFGEAYTAAHPTFTPRSGSDGLAQATKGRVIRTRQGAIVKLTNAKPYASAIDKGARAHEIRAKGTGYLHFRGRRGWVRKKAVNHPGNRPYKFLYRATVAAGRVFEKRLAIRLAVLARSF